MRGRNQTHSKGIHAHPCAHRRSLGPARKRRRASSSANDANANYTRYADPDNPANTYTRGRMPTWLIEKMAANGFDPADADHRQHFKSEHLVQLAA